MGRHKATPSRRQQLLPTAGAATGTQGYRAALGLVPGAQLAASTPPPLACRAAAMAGQKLPQVPTPHRLGLILPRQHRLEPPPAAAPPSHPAAGSAQGPIQTTSHKAGWIKHDGAKHVVGASPVAGSFWTWCGYHMFMQHQGAATGHAVLHPTRSTNEEQCRVKTMACKTWKSRWVLWALHLRASDTTD